MLNLSAIRAPGFDKTAARNALVVGFVSMSGAALLNSAAWLTFGSDGSAGTAGFALALTASAIATALTGYQTCIRAKELGSIEKYAKAIAEGDVAIALNKDEIRHPLHEHLNMVAEAQLRRVEEFHRLLEDSRIREERLYDALDALEDEIAVFDASGMLVSVNKAFNRHCNVAGVTVGPGMMRREILKAMAIAPLNEVPLDERDMWVDHQFQMRDLALSGQHPVDSIQRDGRHLRFTLIVTPSKNQIEITTDITDSVALVQNAERLRREAEAASRTKNATITRLQDNIRTPMTGVLAAAELLSATDLDDQQRSKLDLIRRSSGVLLGVVQEMIEVCPDSQAASVPEPEQFPQPNPAEPTVVAELALNPNELVDVHARASRRAILVVRSEELLGRLSILLQQDNIQTIALESVELAMSLIADNGEGGVKTDLVMSDDAQALNALTEWASTVLPANRPTIIDLNAVMSEGYAPVMNAGTAQPAQSVTTQTAPSAIPEPDRSRALPPRMEAPAFPAAALTLVAQESAKSKHIRLPLDVMVVEDNDVNQILYDQLLSKCGYQYLIVSSGEEGINTAKREKPRLILMDISMRGINGLDATRSLRASGMNRRPAIIGMTSHLLTGDREKCLAAGMDDYSLKPTSSGPLRTQIADWMGLSEQVEQAAG